MKDDTFNGENGYWDNGAWFPESIKPIDPVLIKLLEQVCDCHTPCVKCKCEIQPGLDYSNDKEVREMMRAQEIEFRQMRDERRHEQLTYVFSIVIAAMLIVLFFYFAGVLYA